MRGRCRRGWCASNHCGSVWISSKEKKEVSEGKLVIEGEGSWCEELISYRDDISR